MSEKSRLDTTRRQKIAPAYWESAALMAAVELELFTAIANGDDMIPAADGAMRHDASHARGRGEVLSAGCGLHRRRGPSLVPGVLSRVAGHKPS